MIAAGSAQVQPCLARRIVRCCLMALDDAREAIEPDRSLHQLERRGEWLEGHDPAVPLHGPRSSERMQAEIGAHVHESVTRREQPFEKRTRARLDLALQEGG